MLTAHIGVAIFITGVTLVKTYETEKAVQMDVGDTVSIGPYTFEFKGVSNAVGETTSMPGAFRSHPQRAGRATMHPEKHKFLAQPEPMTVADIDTGFTRDLYVSLGEAVGRPPGSCACTTRLSSTGSGSDAS